MKLIPEIKEKIDKWMNDNTSRSVAELSRRANVSYTSTRRIVQNEGAPSYSNLANILSVVMGDNNEELPSILKKQFPQNTRAIDIFLKDGVMRDRDRASLSHAINRSPIISVVYAMIESCENCSIEMIAQEYGRNGTKAIEDLKSEGLIEEDSGLIKKTERGRKINFSIETMSKAILAHTEHSNLENIQNNMAIASLQWSGTSQKGFVKAIDLTVDYIEKIKKALDDHPGKIPVYFLTLGNSYIDIQSLKEKEDIL